MTEATDRKHSPTPWRLEENRQDQRRFILEAGNHVLGACWGNYWDFPDGNTDESDRRAEADAAYIVEAVNAHERLVAENARLRAAIQRADLLVPQIVRNTSVWAEVRAALGEEAKDGNA